MPVHGGAEKLVLPFTVLLLTEFPLQSNKQWAEQQLRNWNQEVTSNLSFNHFVVNLQRFRHP